MNTLEVVAGYELDMRREIAGLRQALTAKDHAKQALEQRVERLEKIIRTLAADEQASVLRRETMYREVL